MLSQTQSVVFDIYIIFLLLLIVYAYFILFYFEFFK